MRRSRAANHFAGQVVGQMTAFMYTLEYFWIFIVNLKMFSTPYSCLMNTDTLGRNRALSSSIGIGSATFGREIDRATATAMLDYALAQGITRIDTAAAYSNGTAEKIIGSWLNAHQPIRPDLFVATKLLPPYSADRIVNGFAESLARLQTEYVDLLYLHQWHESALWPETLRALDTLARSGRARALGVSNFNAAQVADMRAHQASSGWMPVSYLQNIHNLAVEGFDPTLRALGASTGIAFVGYSPLGAGFLTGKHRERIEPGSRFAIAPAHQAVYANPRAHQRLATLQAVAERTGHSMTHLALAWALHDPHIATVLVGGRTTQHIDQALAAATFDAPELFAELSAS